MGWERAGLGGRWPGRALAWEGAGKRNRSADQFPCCQTLALTDLLTNAPCVIRTHDRLLRRRAIAAQIACGGAGLDEGYVSMGQKRVKRQVANAAAP